MCTVTILITGRNIPKVDKAKSSQGPVKSEKAVSHFIGFFYLLQQN